MAIIESLFIGVISGVVASVTYAFIKRMVCPKIKIVDIAIHDEQRLLFLIKIINRTKTRLSDVSCSLQYFQSLPNGYKTIECIPYAKVSPTIEGFTNDQDISNAPSLYAVQYGFRIPENVAFNEKDKLVFSIKAIHPLSGTAAYNMMAYSFKEDGKIVKNMAFDAGNNMGVHHTGS